MSGRWWKVTLPRHTLHSKLATRDPALGFFVDTSPEERCIRARTMSRKINVAIGGLGFGAEFIPIYQRHPGANMYAICQRTKAKLDAIGDAFGVERRFTPKEIG